MGASAVRERIIATAASREGTLYSLPPDGVTTLDCSLFVLVTLRDAGVGLPAWARTAEQIRQACTRIELDETEPGDLLFFEHTYEPDGEPGPDGRIASHVGITLGAGNRRMWDCHCSSGDSGLPGVGVTEINEYYWEPKLFEARRPPGLEGGTDGGTADGNAGGAEPGDGEPSDGEPGHAGLGAVFRVTTGGVRLRAAPGTSGPIVVADLGEATELIAVDDRQVSADGHTWRHVRAPGGEVGWVASAFLKPVPPILYTVTEDGVRLRSAPGLGGRIESTLAQGTVVVDLRVDVEQADGRAWRHVAASGSRGWVAAEYLARRGD